MKPHILSLSAIALTSCMLPCGAAIVVTTAKDNTTTTPYPFTVSSADLGQASGNTYSGTTSEAATEAGQLFNGLTGDTNDGSTAAPGEVTISGGGSVTVTFNTAVNTMGYDITGITSVFGWGTQSGGRSNQGYGIVLTFMDNSTATLLSPTVWEPNNSTGPGTCYWTQVVFSNSGGGALTSNTFSLNGGSAVAGTGVVASGVKSITFNNFSAANSTGVVIAREFDVFGTATTIPEPGVALLGAVGMLGLLRRRRSA